MELLFKSIIIIMVSILKLNSCFFSLIVERKKNIYIQVLN